MDTPPLVERALAFTAARGPGITVEPDVGALLHVLAARRGLMRVAEIGTGSAVGAAWIVSALPPQVPFFGVESDPALAALASELLADDPEVTIFSGSWRESLPSESPFDLVSVAEADARRDPDAVVGLLAPGGTVALTCPPADRDDAAVFGDPWLHHPLLTAIELQVGAARRIVVAVRR